MDQALCMILQIIQVMAQKQKLQTLCEFEILMYEQMCNMVASFARTQDLVIRMQAVDLENQLREKTDAGSDNENRKSSCPDEETDSGSGSAGIPV